MSTPFSRMTAALVSATNEFSLAAANLNIDFSLVKIDAPMEFRALGKELSVKRRADAEVGSFHVTARRLGALFEGLLPKTPRLLEVYGLRASEISQRPDINPKGDESQGIFASQTGIDGTSIWAAATSGIGAIGVHLLACMLARIWTPTEATSIWVEIIEGRRQEIAARFESGAEMHWQTFNAARPELSRKQIAEWDTSARSWLRGADQAMEKRQKQIMLIVNNVGLKVNNIPGTYESVKRAWITALETMEKVVQGMPYNIHDGSALLALISWHLYPDMVVIGSAVQEVRYGDSLIPSSGQVTIGLQGSNSSSDHGLKWSLSLAHLRYYGDPSVVTRLAGIDTSRVSFNQFAFVIFGAVLSGWDPSEDNMEPFQDDEDHIVEAADALVLLNDTVRKGRKEPLLRKRKREQSTDSFSNADLLKDYTWDARRLLSSPSGWLGFLATAAEEFLESRELDRQMALRLVKLGLRSGKKFLDKQENYPGQLLGLTSVRVVVGLMDNSSQRIQFLRQYAQTLGLREDQAIIRFPLSDLPHSRRKYPQSDKSTPPATYEGEKSQTALFGDRFGFATAIPCKTPTGDENSEAEHSFKSQHMRWVPKTGRHYIMGDLKADEEIFSFNHSLVSLSRDCDFLLWLQPPSIFSGRGQDLYIERITDSYLKWAAGMLSAEEGSHDGIEFHDMYGDLSYDDDIPQFLRQAAVDESAGTGDSGFFASALGLDMSAQHLESGRDVHQPSTIQVPTESMTFTFLAGDPDLAAIYIREGYLLKSQKRNRNSLQEIKVDGHLEEATTDNDETSEESAKDFDKNLDAACNEETDSISQMDSMEESSEDEKHQGAVGSDLEDDDTYPQPSAGPLRNPKLSLSTLKDLFKSNIISSERFVEYLALLSDNTGTWRDNPECKFAFDFSCSRYEAFFTSLRALVATSEVYKLLPSATIDLKILSQHLEDAEWIPESDCLSGSQLLLQPLRGLSLSLQETFACITMFETGIINLETHSFDNVMAISSGDAIFVAATLLCDPYECPQATEIRRIVGNVGRAGVSLLISPAQLRKEKQKISSWDCVTHEDFNGLAEDNFRSTSVHLSFTGYEMALDSNNHGVQDSEIHYIETVVSVHDQGEWVADIDILSAITDKTLIRHTSIHNACTKATVNPQRAIS